MKNHNLVFSQFKSIFLLISLTFSFVFLVNSTVNAQPPKIRVSQKAEPSYIENPSLDFINSNTLGCLPIPSLDLLLIENNLWCTMENVSVNVSFNNMVVYSGNIGKITPNSIVQVSFPLLNGNPNASNLISVDIHFNDGCKEGEALFELSYEYYRFICNASNN